MKKSYSRVDIDKVDCSIIAGNHKLMDLPQEKDKEIQNNNCFEGLVYYQTSNEYIFREVAGDTILIPVGEKVANFNGLVILNETAAFLWKQLGHKCTNMDLILALVEEYKSPIEQVEADVNEFLELALERGVVDKC